MFHRVEIVSVFDQTWRYPTMQPTRNTLSENIRAQSVELLNKHLAAAIDLHASVKQAHWNMRGPGFIAIRELFGFGEANTADVFPQISRGIDQQLWFVESHVAPVNGHDS